MDFVKKSALDLSPKPSTSGVWPRLPKKCLFCYRTTDDRVKYGEFKFARGIVAHYYCILMSTNLNQRGGDNEGIEGFLVNDIRNLLENTVNAKCVYCHLPHATSICLYTNCKKAFHYPCGQENQANAQFCGRFASYCKEHNSVKRKNTQRFLALNTDYPITCIYCQDVINDEDYYVTECCRSCVMHIKCVRAHALAVGYFTRCPNCNSGLKFVLSIKLHGIFVPDVDNMWELENDAVINSSEVEVYCEAKICKCRHGIGRVHDAPSGFCRLLLCRFCGSNAIHRKCKGYISKFYTCSVCRPVMARKRKSVTKATNENPMLRVVIEPLKLEDLIAMNVTIPPRYNLRSRSSTK